MKLLDLLTSFYITPASGGKLSFHLLYHLGADIRVNREVLSLFNANLSHNYLDGGLDLQMLQGLGCALHRTAIN